MNTCANTHKVKIETEVSVIIVNYNTSQLVCDCIESIYKNTTDVRFEIIVVDNGSQPENLKLLKGMRYPFKLISLDENLGFGKANNKGLALAAGEYLFFLNPDTILMNNAIKILKDYIESTPKCGACGGNLYDGNSFPTHSYNKRFPGIIDELDQALKRKLSKLLDGGNTMFNHTDHPLKVAFITGADLMVRREALMKTGAFAPSFFMYYEDTELQYRLKKAGYDIWNIPHAKIIHLEGKSFSKSRDREKRILVSRQKYYELTGGIAFRNFMNCYYLILNRCAYAIAKVFNIESMKAKLWQRLSILKEI